MNLQEVLNKLKKIKHDFTLISANFEDIEKRQTLTTISEETYSRIKNKVVNGLLKIVERIKETVKQHDIEKDEKSILNDFQRYESELLKHQTKEFQLVKLNGDLKKMGYWLIGILGLILVAIIFNTYYLGKINSEQIDRDKTIVSFKIIQGASENLKDFRMLLQKNEVIGRWYDEKTTTPLSEEEAELLFNSCTKDEKRNPEDNPFSCNDKVNVYNFLNYMEGISAAYMNNVCDREMIEKSFGDIALKAFVFYENLIQRLDEEPDRKTKAWEPFQDFVKEYRKKNLNGK